LEGVKVSDLVNNIGSGAGSAPAAQAAKPAAAAPAAAAKKGMFLMLIYVYQ
jgi:hypothetical protein